jgi:ATP-dependent DNA helicase RecQ
MRVIEEQTMDVAPDRFAELLTLIDRHWGFTELRPLQEPAMKAVLERRDSLVVMPTGGGKSLCYQAPALLCEREPTLVVSPLISLMKDQVDALRAAGVSARHIDSTLSDAQRVQTFNELRAGTVRLLFVSPERLLVPNFLTFIQSLGVRTFAIDEAHCISHWGHDFRQEYRQLRTLRQHFPNATFHGYTATATERVRLDIADQLGLRNPAILVGNFDRPNLVYRVVPRGKHLEQVVEVVKRHAGEAGIIYCIRRKDVDELTQALQAMNIEARPYHAGMTSEDRKSVQEAFRAEKCNLIVATVAFGMGIDRSNVRFVLHSGMPKSIEHYQQESGRAGRDGLEAECAMLYSGRDFMLWKFILEKSAEENQADADFLPAAMAQVEEMNSYCRSAVCRHRLLVEHFGQPFAPENCQACDMCLGEVDIETESQETARKILSCVARVQERFGIGHVVAVLRGEETEKIARYGHEKLSTFGLLKEHKQANVRDWVSQMIGLGLLDQAGDEYPVLKLNPISWEVLRNERQVQLRKSASRSASRRARVEEDAWQGVDRELCEMLRRWRRETADARSMPPFAIFHDSTLRELARVRPSSKPKMRAVYGIGDAKLDAFGDDVLRIIGEYCAAIGLARDAGEAPLRKMRDNEGARSVAEEIAVPLFRNAASLDEVVRATARKLGTVADYLVGFIKRERPASIDVWVPDEIQQRIIAAARKHGSAFLRPIFEELQETVSYEMIKISLAFHSIQLFAFEPGSRLSKQ